MTTAHLSHFIASIEDSALAPWASLALWQLTAQSEAIVRQMLHTLDASQFRMLRGAALNFQRRRYGWFPSEIRLRPEGSVETSPAIVSNTFLQ